MSGTIVINEYAAKNTPEVADSKHFINKFIIKAF